MLNRRIVFVGWVLFWLSRPCSAQNSTDDSLTALLAQSSEDTSRIFLLNTIAKDFVFSHPDSAQYYAMQAVLWSDRLNWPAGKGLAYNTLGIVAGIRGHMDSSLTYFKNALAIRELLDDPIETSKTLVNIGIIYDQKSNQDEALKYYLKALRLQETTGDSFAIAHSLMSIGINYRHRGDDDAALEYLLQAQNYFERRAMADQRKTLFWVGDIYVRKGQPRSALDCFRRAIPITNSLMDVYTMGSLCDGMGRAFMQMDSLDQSMYYLGKALVCQMQIGDKTNYAGTLTSVAEVYRKQGHLDLSTEYAEKSLFYSKATGSKDAMLKAQNILHKNYSDRGNFKKAYDALLHYSMLYDSIFSTKRETEINRLLLNRQEAENEALRKDNALKDALIREQNLQRTLLIIGIILVALMAGIITVSLRLKARSHRLLEEKNDEIHRQNEERKKTIGIVEAINSELELDKLLSAIFEIVRPLLQVQSGSVLLRDPITRNFKFRAAFGVPIEALQDIELTEQEAVRRYVEGSETIGDDLYFIRGLVARLGTDKFMNLPVIDSVFVIRLMEGQELAGFLFFDDVKEATTQNLLLLTGLKEHIRTALIKARLLNQLKTLNEKKNEYLGIVAHDLRNPLTTIVGYTDLIIEDFRKGKVNSAGAIEDLSKIAGVSRHMNRFISELLDISAIESGKVRMDMKDSDLKVIVGECEYLHRRSSQHKNIELIVDYATPLPQVNVDVEKISSVIDNLLSNAIKYTHPGGKVNVHFEDRNGEIVTHVQDTGQGLSAEDLNKVFTSFKRLSSKPTGGEPSTGLGLAIVKKIVELHHGRVWVKSKPGEGSTFSFSLPVTPKT